MQPHDRPIDFCSLDHHAYDLRGLCVACGHPRGGSSSLVVLARVTTEADAHELAERLRTIATWEFRRALALALDTGDDPTPEEARILALLA
jgi:hypothetical protein